MFFEEFSQLLQLFLARKRYAIDFLCERPNYDTDYILYRYLNIYNIDSILYRGNGPKSRIINTVEHIGLIGSYINN